MQEIERKFLVNSLKFKKEAASSFQIAQGFLNTHAERTVRVRIKGKQGFLTIKGKSNESGTSRFEWEKEISVVEAKELLNLCEKGIIEKIRYNIPYGNHIFEVDEFFGENEGLIVAEVELQDENETFQKPDWLSKEVTGQTPYYNSQLSKKPYKTWHHE
jgi:CYTH domain-containing protein